LHSHWHPPTWTRRGDQQTVLGSELSLLTYSGAGAAKGDRAATRQVDPQCKNSFENEGRCLGHLPSRHFSIDDESYLTVGCSTELGECPQSTASRSGCASELLVPPVAAVWNLGASAPLPQSSATEPTEDAGRRAGLSAQRGALSILGHSLEQACLRVTSSKSQHTRAVSRSALRQVRFEVCCE
jgi:hypothetical protein